MRTFLPILLLVSLTGSARANPMLEKCLAFTPPVCALSDESTQKEFLTCFETVRLNTAKTAEAACAEELAHARVHISCGDDIPKLCGRVKPGGNRTMNCLRRNMKKLDKDCRKELKAYDEIVAPAGGERKKGRGTSGVSAKRC